MHIISNGFYNAEPFTIDEWENKQIYDDHLIIGNKTINFDDDDSYYSTKNPTTSHRSRKKVHLLGYNLISIDIDNHNESATHEKDSLSLLANIKADLIDTGVIPEPDEQVFTGRGLQIRFKFDLVDTSFKKEYKEIVNTIIIILDHYIKSHNSFNLFEIDIPASVDPVRPMRLGGINQKNGNQVRYFDNPQQHTLESLTEHLGIEVKAEPRSPLNSLKTMIKDTQVIAEPYTVTNINNGLKFTLKHRLKVLNKAKSHYDNINQKEGYRYNYLFLYANTVKQINPTIAQDLTINFNNSFIEPLEHDELKKILDLIPNNHIFRFKTETFNAWLSGKNNDIARMVEPNPDKNPTRTQQRAIKRAERLEQEKYIKELLNTPELTNKAIAERLEVTPRTIRRYRVKYDIPSQLNDDIIGGGTKSVGECTNTKDRGLRKERTKALTESSLKYSLTQNRVNRVSTLSDYLKSIESEPPRTVRRCHNHEP